MKEALFWHAEGARVRCELCPHDCLIPDQGVGRCRVRQNEGGVLYSLNYGKVTSVALDPIEKKPLYHFHPGKPILSLGSFGCNFACKFCQNWPLVEGKAPADDIKATDVPALAKRARSFGVAYTYNEPTIWYEFVLESARLCKTVGLKNVLVTNGFINAQPLDELLPYIDALNIDIKTMRQTFHDKLTGGSSEPVFETCRRAKARAHVEVTNLIIPGYNDTVEDFEDLGSWVAENLGRETPLHVSAYFPRHKLSAPPTSLSTISTARQVLTRYLDYVYMGNVPSGEGSDTVCPQCGNLLVERVNYHSRIVGLEGTRCARCQTGAHIITD